MVQIDGDVVFFDGTLFENLDEGVLCRYFQVINYHLKKAVVPALFHPAGVSIV